MSARPPFSPRRIISELEIDAFGVPANLPPLSASEMHRDKTVTRTCSHCGRRMLCRDLVESRQGIRCINKTKCALANGVVDTSLDERAEADDDAQGIHRNQLANFRRGARAGRPVAPVRAADADATIIKTCTCCARTFTRAQWRALELLSAQDVTDEGVTTHEEMRNCGDCGSTLMVVSDRERTTLYPERES